MNQLVPRPTVRHRQALDGPLTATRLTQRPACWLAVLLLLSGFAHAEQKVSVDGYDIHYIVVGSAFLTPEVAKSYGIERAAKRAIINLSVIKDGKPVAAHVTGTARDLLSRTMTFDFRELRDRDAIYYLATLRFSEEELWRFRLQVTPDGAKQAIPVSFDQKLYLEK